MKRLITADLHLAAGDRDAYRLDFVRTTLLELVQKHKVDQLLVLGDITEIKDNHPAILVNQVVEAFTVLAKSTEVVILQGNHDFAHKAYPFFEFLKYVEGIVWVGQPTYMDNCLFLPHTRDYKTDWKDLNFENLDFIFAHNTFIGASANGQKMSGIPIDIFPEDAMVLSGDIHEPQTFGVVTYTGAPYLCNHGDSYQPRVLLLDGLACKSVKVHGPQKRLIQVTWPEEIEHNAEPGDIVKIRVQLKMEHVADWAGIRADIQDWAVTRELKVHTIQPVVEVVPGERQSLIKGGSPRTDEQFLDSFIKRTGIDLKTAEVGKELL